MTSTTPPEPRPKKTFSHFRTFFLRGLAILLPTVLTIWILMAAYQFVQERIADPINQGIRKLVILTSPWPQADKTDYNWAEAQLQDNPKLADKKAEWKSLEDEYKVIYGDKWTPDSEFRKGKLKMFVSPLARERALTRWWNSVRIGGWVVMDLNGLIVAVVLIYLVGRLVGSFIGRRMYSRGEELLQRVPLFKQVYPYVKQVTDFLFGDEKSKFPFSNVVAVQYPRTGLWSVGLVTGETMRVIQDQEQQECITVFVPSSPTPFTGYVITVPRSDTINLPITIDEALRFAVSGGVIIPPSQRIQAAKTPPDEALNPVESHSA